MNALTPSLAIVAARLPSPPSSAELLDDEVAGTTPDWRGIAVPEHLLQRFERRSDAAPLAARPIAGGQIHLLARLPGFGAVLLDAWDSTRQRWRGWLVTPDTAYADACGLVVEERDAPADPRAGLVLCDMPVTLAVTDLGACLGVFSQERLQAARWLELHGRANGAAAAPGVIARVALPGDDYALTGTPLSSELGKDGRVAYRQLLRQGLQQLQITSADAVAPATSPVKAANASRWLKLVTAVAASVMVVQSAWLFLPKEGAVVGNAEFRSGGSGVETGVRTRVLFRAEATEAEIRTWLQREQLEIVAGPDTLGAFTVLSRNRQKVLPPPGPGNPLAVINP
ncbi:MULTISPECIES: hypothetical protein [unclassified Janthinobacterium]|uniref:hypothetical protein n=1 Tax=unclassified Janthinobacterium TaxID=2610881 RepID=UPI001E32E20D|nr:MULTISPECIES: hypothetical protein [unclassified Janthinobacterium]MCC7644709.1 hypothetical protein [Janthinobacterium sp. EB271-G4-3-1]MCC7691791.1 hypothetical protein [Janthinobacterium sp. EB271-G4-3-2]